MSSRPALAAALGLATALAGCWRGQERTDRTPPPAGQTMEEYLAESGAQRPVRPPDTRAEDSMRLHVIDVGQGAAALVELPCGAILVDTGGEKNERFDGEKALIDYLDAFFERRGDLDRTLALLVVTHPHLDHTRGIAAVLANFRVSNVIDNGDVREDEGGRPQLAMHEWLGRNSRVGHLDVTASAIDPRDGLRGPVVDPVGSCAASALDPSIRVLWSGELGREEVGHDPNNDSVMLRVDLGGASFLLAGDVEQVAIERISKKYREAPQLLDAGVYLVPHHGSRHSTTGDFIARVSPEVAVISAGPYERHLGTEEEFTARAFGHPHQLAIDHLSDPTTGVRRTRDRPREVWVGQRGAWKGRPSEFRRRTIKRAIYATGWDGTVVVTAYASGWIDVTTER